MEGGAQAAGPAAVAHHVHDILLAPPLGHKLRALGGRVHALALLRQVKGAQATGFAALEPHVALAVLLGGPEAKAVLHHLAALVVGVKVLAQVRRQQLPVKF